MGTRPWKLLIYVLADNRIEAAIQQMRDGILSAGAAAAVQLGGPSGMTRVWSSSRGVEAKLDPGASISDASTLTEFLNEAERQFPDTRTALAVVGHGSGLDCIRARPAPRSAAAEAPTTRPKDQLLIHSSAVREGIQNSQKGLVDVLAFNACCMALLEVEYQMRDVFEVLVASQAFSLGPWPYPRIATSLASAQGNGAKDTAKRILGCLQKDKRRDVTSACSSDGITRIESAFEMFARHVHIHLGEEGCVEVIEKAARGVARFDDPSYVDLMSLLNEFGQIGGVRRIASHIQEVVSEDVIVKACPEVYPNACGLSVFWPDQLSIDLEAAYDGLAFSKSWHQFLRVYQARIRNLGFSPSAAA